MATKDRIPGIGLQEDKGINQEENGVTTLIQDVELAVTGYRNLMNYFRIKAHIRDDEMMKGNHFTEVVDNNKHRENDKECDTRTEYNEYIDNIEMAEEDAENIAKNWILDQARRRYNYTIHNVSDILLHLKV